MIELTTLAGKPLWINPDLIRYIESTPDTILAFIDDRRMVVRESPSEIQAKIVQFRKQIQNFLFNEIQAGG
jgi:flagellar protein FlbD